MYQQVDSTVHLGNGNIFSVLPHKTFPYSGVDIQEWKMEGWLRGDCGMIASLLPYYQLRQVSTGCSSTLESLPSQNSWHHPTGSREALLQGETWATKICFDPNGATGRSFRVSVLALKREREDAADIQAFVKCRPHSTSLNLCCVCRFSQA